MGVQVIPVHTEVVSFPFPPIPIPNSVFYSHSHGIPMRFLVPLGIPFPCTSLARMQLVLLDFVGKIRHVEYKQTGT